VISTHILDTERGRPGAGITVALYRGDKLVSLQETDGDGRIRDLTAGAPLDRGPYRLVFHVTSLFFQRVEVTILVEPDQHYHLPLLLAPYACVIYRGS